MYRLIRGITVFLDKILKVQQAVKTVRLKNVRKTAALVCDLFQSAFRHNVW